MSLPTGAFDRCFAHTMGNEGGYVFDENDPGGETYRGIARKKHPSWPGWPLIDARKNQGGSWRERLIYSEELQVAVMDFYRERFWKPLNCAQMDSEAIAAEVFDTAVNMGKAHAGRFLQRMINAFNRREKLYPNIAVDGGIGSKTLASLALCLKSVDEAVILTGLNCLQGARYIDLMEKNEFLEKYARGWFGRVTLVK